MKINFMVLFLCIATVAQARVFNNEKKRKFLKNKLVHIVARELKKSGGFLAMHENIAQHHGFNKKLHRPARRS